MGNNLSDLIVSKDAVCTVQGDAIFFETENTEIYTRIHARDGSKRHVDMPYDRRAADMCENNARISEKWRLPPSEAVLSDGCPVKFKDGVQVGINTTHVYGEQTLQLTLNTHHTAGQAGSTVVDSTDHVKKILTAVPPVQPVMRFKVEPGVTLEQLREHMMPICTCDVVRPLSHGDNENEMTFQWTEDADEGLVDKVCEAADALPGHTVMPQEPYDRDNMAMTLTLRRTDNAKSTQWMSVITLFENKVVRGIAGITSIYCPDPVNKPACFEALYKRDIAVNDRVSIARRIMATRGVISTSVIPNDANVAFVLYGTEAAVSVVVQQLSESFGNIHPFHMRLVAYAMTRWGMLRSIKNLRLLPVASNVLQYACVGSMIDTFFNAALNNHSEEVHSSNSRIMLNIPMRQAKADDGHKIVFPHKMYTLDEDRKKAMLEILTNMSLDKGFLV
jgi:hypothetical protein